MTFFTPTLHHNLICFNRDSITRFNFRLCDLFVVTYYGMPVCCQHICAVLNDQLPHFEVFWWPWSPFSEMICIDNSLIKEVKRQKSPKKTSTGHSDYTSLAYWIVLTVISAASPCGLPTEKTLKLNTAGRWLAIPEMLVVRRQVKVNQPHRPAASENQQHNYDPDTWLDHVACLCVCSLRTSMHRL